MHLKVRTASVSRSCGRLQCRHIGAFFVLLDPGQGAVGKKCLQRTRRHHAAVFRRDNTIPTATLKLRSGSSSKAGMRRTRQSGWVLLNQPIAAGVTAASRSSPLASAVHDVVLKSERRFFDPSLAERHRSDRETCTPPLAWSQFLRGRHVDLGPTPTRPRCGD